MKTKIAALLIVCVAAHVGADPRDEIIRSEITEACKIPYRKVEGRLYDLIPRFNFVQTQNSWADGSQIYSSKPLPEFQFLHGEVLSVT